MRCLRVRWLYVRRWAGRRLRVWGVSLQCLCRRWVNVNRQGCSNGVATLRGHLGAPDDDGAGLVHAPTAGMSRHWLEGMRREGLLLAVGPEHYLRADAVDWPQARQLVLRAGLPNGCVVALACAVWAHGGPMPALDALGRLTLQVITKPHTRMASQPGLRLHRSQVSAEEVEWLGDLPVTTLLRTTADLAVLGDVDDEEALAWLLARPEVSPAAAWSLLRRRSRVPGTRRAAAVLRLAADGVKEPLAGVVAAGVSSTARI